MAGRESEINTGEKLFLRLQKAAIVQLHMTSAVRVKHPQATPDRSSLNNSLKISGISHSIKSRGLYSCRIFNGRCRTHVVHQKTKILSCTIALLVRVDNREALAKITVLFGYFYADHGELYSSDLENYYCEKIQAPATGTPFDSSNHLFFWTMSDEFTSALLKFLEMIRIKDSTLKVTKTILY